MHERDGHLVDIPFQLTGIDNVAAHVPDKRITKTVFVFLPFRRVFERIHTIRSKEPIDELISGNGALVRDKIINMARFTVDNASAPAHSDADLVHKRVVTRLLIHIVAI